MKGEDMRMRYLLSSFVFAFCLFIAGTPVRAVDTSGNAFKLKPGARGSLCTTCHVTFQDKLKSPFVHTPVKTGECAGCHNPHTSSHGKMLGASSEKICYKCHDKMIPEKAVSSHKVVAEGQCVKCHDPHAANNKFNVIRTGNDLCFGCHKDMEAAVAKVKFKHNPVEKGCVTCHTPHASNNASSLLREPVPALCVKCHKTDKPSFVKQHMNYPVEKAKCTTCHNPHGSDKGALLFNTVHRPVVSKMCNQCHEDPASQNPFSTKKAGFELCKACHSTMINDIFSKNRLHWSVIGKRGCLNCHSPHASDQDKLLRGPMNRVCGKCHADTLERQEKSLPKHKPVREGMCMSCHFPHSSDNVFFFRKVPETDLCGTCHDWQKHSTHPIGEKIIDPRNKNLTVQCLSCHRSHGTGYKAKIYFPTVSEMCTQCHMQYKR